MRPGLEVTLRFDDARAARRLTVVRARRHKRGLIVGFAEISNASDAEQVVGGDVGTERQNAPLAEDEYYDEDLIGCRLMQGERMLGNVVAVRHYPAQDVLELEGGALVPLVRAFVREIDLAARIVRVELPPGLVEGEPL